MSPRRAKSDSAETPSAWAERLADALADRRQRAGAFVAEHRRQLDDIEQQIAGELESLTEELKAESLDHQRRGEQLENRQAALEAKADQLAELQTELTNHQIEFQEFQARVESREQDLSLREDKLHKRSEELAEESTRLEEEAASLEKQHQVAQQQQHQEQQETEDDRLRLNDQQRRLETERSELALRDSEIKSQRRRIARQLRTQKSNLLAEIEQQRASLQHAGQVDDAELREQVVRLREETIQERERSEVAMLEAKHREIDLQEACDEAENEATTVKIALGQARDDQDDMRRQLAESRLQLSTQEEELARLHEQLQQAPPPLETERDEASQEEIDQLRHQRVELLNRLDAAEREAAQAVSAEVPRVQDEDLRRRFELAVDDVRELKTRNAELERKLEETSPATALPKSDRGNLDWEAQKKRLLAQLEDEFDDEDEEEEEAKERLSIEGTIRITDQIVSSRDREIADLKRQLQEVSTAPADDTAVGAKAIAKLLDQDELIVKERGNLRRIQQEWKEKLRKSEVDISVERARLARERSQLEETLHALKQNEGESTTDKDAKQGKTKSSGRWLSRLGLANDDDEK